MRQAAAAWREPAARRGLLARPSAAREHRPRRSPPPHRCLRSRSLRPRAGFRSPSGRRVGFERAVDGRAFEIEEELVTACGGIADRYGDQAVARLALLDGAAGDGRQLVTIRQLHLERARLTI